MHRHVQARCRLEERRSEHRRSQAPDLYKIPKYLHDQSLLCSSRMIPRSSTRSLSGTAISYNATATTSSTRWTSGDTIMSFPSPRKEMGQKKPFGSFTRRWSCSVSTDELDSDHESTVLPPPAVAVSAACNRQKRAIRIDGGRGLRDRWARFRRRLDAGTSPSTSSLVDDPAPGSNAGPCGDAQGKSQYGDDTEVDEVVVDR